MRCIAWFSLRPPRGLSRCRFRGPLERLDRRGAVVRREPGRGREPGRITDMREDQRGDDRPDPIELEQRRVRHGDRFGDADLDRDELTIKTTHIAEEINGEEFSFRSDSFMTTSERRSLRSSTSISDPSRDKDGHSTSSGRRSAWRRKRVVSGGGCLCRHAFKECVAETHDDVVRLGPAPRVRVADCLDIPASQWALGHILVVACPTLHVNVGADPGCLPRRHLQTAAEAVKPCARRQEGMESPIGGSGTAS